jgi:hypothetical protein
MSPGNCFMPASRIPDKYVVLRIFNAGICAIGHTCLTGNDMTAPVRGWTADFAAMPGMVRSHKRRLTGAGDMPDGTDSTVRIVSYELPAAF